MDKTFVIGMIIGATAQVGAAIVGITKVGSALKALEQKKVNLGEKLAGIEKASSNAEMKITHIGSAIGFNPANGLIVFKVRLLHALSLSALQCRIGSNRG